MHRHTLHPLAILLLFLMLLPGPMAFADGKLDDFEQQATTDGPDRPEPHTQHDTTAVIDDDSFSADFWLLPFLMIGNGGVASWEQAKTREPGSFTIPVARLDLAGHEIESDVIGGSLGFEGGYGPLAIWLQRTRFEEKVPQSSLTLSYLHGLYRMSLHSSFEIDFGIGAATLKGNTTSKGGGVSLPIRVFPSRHVGLEFRPVWSSINGHGVSDYTLGLLGGWNHLKIQAGYRWLSTGNASLNGPFAGLAMTY